VKALLDTHVWLWCLLGDQRLKKTHLALIEDQSTELFLSPISIWEAHLLIERQRLAVNTSPERWLHVALRSLPVREAKFNFAVAMRSRRIRLPHGDPADRFIAATAAEMKIPLMTFDTNLLECPDIECLK
jgi:PIN domain nuclease of toxin-antitoxin system